MNFLFLHPNFPGQYLQLSRYLGHTGRHNVMFLSAGTNGSRLQGVQVGIYKAKRKATKGVHHYIKMAEEAVLDGQAVIRALDALRQKGFVPDVIVGHTGWGSTLYVKDMYPNVPLIGYFEWYYSARGADVYYWPDEEPSMDDKMRIRTMNSHHLVNLQACDVRYTPTQWQKSQFPDEYRDSLRVLHEGIETDYFHPMTGAKLKLPRVNLDLTEAEEIVTYVSRGFEPYRGFPQFMDAIRILLKERPKCHVVIVGIDKAFYGPQYSKDAGFAKYEQDKGGFDKERVHFTGHLERDEYLQLLQASTVHVYLTRPFILSWSCLEAMAAGCCLVGSATPPVEEVMEDGVNGLLANFRRPEHIAFRIKEALEDKALRERLGKAARETILERFDLKDCLKQQIDMIYGAMK